MLRQRCSQKSFGKRIGIGQAAQSALEKGIRNVTNRNVDLIRPKDSRQRKLTRTGDGPIFQELSRDEEIAILSQKFCGLTIRMIL